MDIFEKIQKIFPNLSRNHKKIAAYISGNGTEASFASVSELASKAAVSESSVVRFAQELGYTGYPPFRRELQNEFRNRIGIAARLRRTVSNLPNQGLVESLFQKDIELIEETLSELSQTDFSKAIDLIWKARRIFIVGLRSSFSLAYFLYFRLVRLRLDVRLIMITGGTSLLEQLALLDRRDLLIAMGLDQIPKETRIAIDHALRSNAKILGVTDLVASEIALKASISLFARRRPHSTQSLSAFMTLLNALAIGVATKKKSRALKALRHLDQMEVIMEKIYEGRKN
jgi:DNA-binding MurR/RpiR family transcriptional regulator